MHDVFNQKNHTHNQSRAQCQSKSDNLWELLLDNQSTCDIVINRKTLTNIRIHMCALLLHAQDRDCVIDQVGNVKGVGLV